MRLSIKCTKNFVGVAGENSEKDDSCAAGKIDHLPVLCPLRRVREKPRSVAV